MTPQLYFVLSVLMMALGCALPIIFMIWWTGTDWPKGRGLLVDPAKMPTPVAHRRDHFRGA